MTNMEFIGNYVKRSMQTLTSLDVYKLCNAMDAVRNAIIDGRIIFTCGNGGSAAIASHFATDIVKCVAAANKLYQCSAISLTESTSTLTAAANDTCYEDVFLPSLRAFTKRGDILIAISGSGNSPNVLQAVTFFKQNNIGKVIGVTSAKQGQLKDICDLPLLVQETHMGALEDQFQVLLHIIAYHLIEVPIQ